MPCGLSCGRHDDPQVVFAHAQQTFQHGDLIRSQQESEDGYRRFSESDPQWAWKFRTLQAESLLWQGKYPEVVALLDSSMPPSFSDVTVALNALRGLAHARQGDLARASGELGEAQRLCSISSSPACGDAFQDLGLVALGQNHFSEATRNFEQSLSFARSSGDRFLEATSLLNLGALSLKTDHFDEAIDESDASYRIARTLNAADIALVAEGNVGWAYYRLGDSERALEPLLEAARRADQLGDLFSQENNLTNIGYVHMDSGKFDLAELSFRNALALAKTEGSKEHMLNALRVLARLALRTGDIDKAKENSEQALRIARETGNRLDELDPMLVQGDVAVRLRDDITGEKLFREIEQDKACPDFLKWQAEHSLARLLEDEGHSDAAEREYRIALATFESARSSLQRNDSKLPFSNNASRIYDDYIHFLVSHGKTEDALRWADYSRARTLAEGLGLLTHQSAAGPPPLNPQQIARLANGTVLFYWLGEKQSYVWAITAQKTTVFTLPPRAEIEAAVKRYNKSLGGPRDVFATADPDGLWLYRNLVAPAQQSPQTAPQKDSRVFIIPDGNLNNLNFETLLVPDPNSAATKLHYWIEDVTISNASSLRVLAVQYQPRSGDAASNQLQIRQAQLQPRSGGTGKPGTAAPGGGGGTIARVPSGTAPRTLLLIGNSVSPNSKYPELPKAAIQMASVAHHFPSTTEQIFAREQATPTAYLDGHPERFSYIHFVAHGTASRLSPLDSAIVLSKTVLANSGPPQTAPNTAAPSAIAAETDNFKLYARDIIRHPLHADLVTISACYGAGERAYSGEGLVGLSWAFLFAGAHNVVAALWEASDASTEELMNKFYDELNQGAPPDVALRNAKLSLLRANNFRNPFYWAPFQLYAGS